MNERPFVRHRRFRPQPDPRVMKLLDADIAESQTPPKRHVDESEREPQAT